MTPGRRVLKRGLDFCFSALVLVALGWFIGLCWIAATIDTRKNGFFLQERVGMNGETFQVIKIRTMREISGLTTTVTAKGDPRITWLGGWMRWFKFDELPQFINVLIGQMSVVGPRPDVPGFADRLEGDDQIILTVRPGITGPATLVIFDEEDLLALCRDAEEYNRLYLFPAKVQLNADYVRDYRFTRDLVYIVATALPPIRQALLGLVGHRREHAGLPDPKRPEERASEIATVAHTGAPRG
jgi:lipopolysaccharide/colanic/teichoic acid biosynthesis glycosyltransferase